MKVKVILQAIIFIFASQSVFAEQLHQAEINNTAHSISGKIKSVIEFTNQSGNTRKVYWLNYDGKRVLYKELLAGETHSQDTFLTHPWLISDKNDNALNVYYPDTKKRIVTLR